MTALPGVSIGIVPDVSSVPAAVRICRRPLRACDFHACAVWWTYKEVCRRGWTYTRSVDIIKVGARSCSPQLCLTLQNHLAE